MAADVLLTGATGFLGRHLTGALRAAEMPAVALVRATHEWPPADWSEGVSGTTALFGSPLRPSDWLSRAESTGARTIVHAAAVVRHSREATDEVMRFNVEGTLNMVRAAKTLGARMVLVSAGGTVGCFHRPDLVADEHAPHNEEAVGQWPYYRSKIEAERQATRLAEKLDVPLTIVRLPVLLGPQDHRRRSTGHVARALENHLPFMPTGGIHFTDVRDVAAALVRLCRKPSSRPVYHLPGTHTTLAAFYQMVAEVSGHTVASRHAPRPFVHGVAIAAERVKRVARMPLPRWLPDPVVLEMSSRYWGLSTLFSHTELDYRARLPRQTLVDTVEWLRVHDAGHALHRAA